MRRSMRTMRSVTGQPLRFAAGSESLQLGRRKAAASLAVGRAPYLAAPAAVALGLSGCSLFPHRTTPAEQVGLPSWHGAGVHGHRTARGGRFAAGALTAAPP